jgi:tetratricopeptide (TPR) repeat protein
VYLGHALEGQHRIAEAEQSYREGLAAYRKAFPPGSPDVAYEALTGLGVLLYDAGRSAEAEPLFREAADIDRVATPPQDYALGNDLDYLAETLVTQQRFADAEPLFRESLVAYRRVLPENTWRLGFIRSRLGYTLTALRRFPEAEKVLIEAERLSAAYPDWHQWAISAFVGLYNAWDQAEPGKGYNAKAKQWSARLLPPYMTRMQAATRPSGK